MVAIDNFGEGMKIGADIEWCLAGNQDNVKSFSKLFKVAQKQSLTVIHGGKE